MNKKQPKQLTMYTGYLNVQEIIEWNPYIKEENLTWDEEYQEWIDSEFGEVFSAAAFPSNS